MMGKSLLIVMEQEIMKILVVTSCGKSKKTSPQPAWKLYKSPRIKAVYNRRDGHEMAILSSRYGLISAEEVIEPYEEVMSKKRADELVLQVVEKITDYDEVIYYRGGAGKEYFDLISRACEKAQKKLLFTGYKNLGDINKIPKLLRS
jgi:hypothetical protein